MLSLNYFLRAVFLYRAYTYWMDYLAISYCRFLRYRSMRSSQILNKCVSVRFAPVLDLHCKAIFMKC